MSVVIKPMDTVSPKISIVIPCFNEEAVIPEALRRILEMLKHLAGAGKTSPDSRIYFIDDGSRDRTWELISSAASDNPVVVGIKLARNVGHQNALLAGLLTADGDAVISIDADLQDDVTVIESMVDEFCKGSQIVYGVRRLRDSDTAFKRLTARGFYRMMKGLGVNVVSDHADFRLIGRPAIEALREFREVNVFLRGMVPLLGFSSAVVHYDRSSRFAGSTKYPLGRMVSLAVDGITSFSVVPLRIITAIGLLVFVGSFALTLWVLWMALLTDKAIPGWASTVLPMYFLGGVQILFLGVLGEYVGKIYTEAKGRPRFIVERIAQMEGAFPATHPRSSAEGTLAESVAVVGSTDP